MSNTERVVDVGWLTLTRYCGTPWLVSMDRVEVVEPDGDGGSSLYFGSGIIRAVIEHPSQIQDMLQENSMAGPLVDLPLVGGGSLAVAPHAVTFVCESGLAGKCYVRANQIPEDGDFEVVLSKAEALKRLGLGVA